MAYHTLGFHHTRTIRPWVAQRAAWSGSGTSLGLIESRLGSAAYSAEGRRIAAARSATVIVNAMAYAELPATRRLLSSPAIVNARSTALPSR